MRIEAGMKRGTHNMAVAANRLAVRVEALRGHQVQAVLGASLPR